MNVAPRRKLDPRRAVSGDDALHAHWNGPTRFGVSHAGGGRGGELTMQQHVSADAYMRFAGDCLRKARAERDPNRRRLLIVIAASWANLADREMAKPSQRIH